MQINYDFEKKQNSTKAIQDKKDAVAKKEMQKQKLVRNGFIGASQWYYFLQEYSSPKEIKLKKENNAAMNYC